MAARSGTAIGFGGGGIGFGGGGHARNLGKIATGVGGGAKKMVNGMGWFGELGFHSRLTSGPLQIVWAGVYLAERPTGESFMPTDDWL